MTPRVPLSAHCALALASLVFAFFPVAGKRFVFPHVDPLGVAAIRVAFGTVALALVARLLGAPSVPGRSFLARLAVCAVFGVIVNQILFLEGLSLSTATHAGILVAVAPAIAYAFALLLRREPLRTTAALGVLLAGAGAAWLAVARGGPEAAVPETLLSGDLLLFTNVASYSVYLVLVKDVLAAVTPLRVLAWVYAFGAIVVVPLGARHVLAVDWGELPLEAALALAFILLGPTSGAYLLNLWALKRATSTLAAVYTCVQPVVATLAAVHLGGERPPILATAGATALIVLGVGLVARAGSREQERERERERGLG